MVVVMATARQGQHARHVLQAESLGGQGQDGEHWGQPQAGVGVGVGVGVEQHQLLRVAQQTAPLRPSPLPLPPQRERAQAREQGGRRRRGLNTREGGRAGLGEEGGLGDPSLGAVQVRGEQNLHGGLAAHPALGAASVGEAAGLLIHLQEREGHLHLHLVI